MTRGKKELIPAQIVIETREVHSIDVLALEFTSFKKEFIRSFNAERNINPSEQHIRIRYLGLLPEKFPNGPWYNKIVELGTEEFPFNKYNANSFHSDLFNSKTCREVIEDVFYAAKEAGIPERFIDVKTSKTALKNIPKIVFEYTPELIIAYNILRLRGYSRRDLVT